MILCPLPLARTSPGRTPNAEPRGRGGPRLAGPTPTRRQGCPHPDRVSAPTRRGDTLGVQGCHNAPGDGRVMTKTILVETVTRKSAVQKMTVARLVNGLARWNIKPNRKCT